MKNHSTATYHRDAAHRIPIEIVKQHTADMQYCDSMATVKQHTADMQHYSSSATVKQHTADMQRVDPWVSAFCFVFSQAGLLDT
ncbi:MAG: hypothetical protein JXB07_08105 [Anaerolineae bacterium]|nr:hypothetical protein [Anaerolineae bacterium]